MSSVGKFARRFILVAHANIIISAQKCRVFLEVVRGKSVVKQETREFALNDDETFSKSTINYFKKLQKRYEYTYISFLHNSVFQGVLDSCNQTVLRKHDIQSNLVKSFCKDNNLFYTSKQDLEQIKQLFKPIGIDFIFSPFLILDRLVNDKYQDGKNRLFVLNTYDFSAIGVYNKEDLLFGAFFKIFSSSEIEDDYDFEEEEVVVEDDTQSSSDDSGLIVLDDLEAEDIDLSDNIDTEELLQEARQTSESTQVQDDGDDEALDLFGRDVKMFEYLKKAIKEYYKSELYKSDFIEEVVIYSDVNFSSEVVSMIEDELFLNVVVEEKNFLAVLNDFSKEELDEI